MEELPLEPRTVAQAVTFALRDKHTDPWQPSTGFTAVLADTRRQMLKLHETLRWLHHHWDLRPTLDDVAAAASRTGPQAKVQGLIWRTVRSALGRYFDEEHELFANLVRMADVLAKRVDDLEADQERVVAALRAELIDLGSSVDQRLAQLARSAGSAAARQQSEVDA